MVNFKIELTEKDVNLVIGGLGKLPAEDSFDLISKIMNDVQNQSKEMSEKAKEEEQKAFEVRAKEYFKKDKMK